MARYIIGDVHGCWEQLQQLLKDIQYQPGQDALWLAGDLGNRGPDSLSVYRFVMQTPNVFTILGNHEFHLMALYHGCLPDHKKHSFHSVLDAPDAKDIVHWLTQQPLLHNHNDFLLVHAGVHPNWSVEEAADLAQEVETQLQNSDTLLPLLQNIYGDQPTHWSPELTGWERLRCITNIMTRMRFCTPDMALDFEHTGPVGSQPEGLIPWFDIPGTILSEKTVYFGHWSALQGNSKHDRAIATDGGCVWGGKLIARRVAD